MTATLLTFPVFRAFDSNGAPLAGGLLYSYQAGTTTPLATYVDQAGVTQNTNPVVLDSTGTANVWLGDSTYKLVLKDKDGVQQWSVDNIQSEGVLINGVYTNLANTSDVSKGDALIGVKSPLEGAVATTQHEVNSRIVYVMDFLSDAQKNDPNLDRSGAINAAIASTSAGTVVLPLGISRVDSPIIMKNSINLVGYGTTATWLKYYGSTDAIVISNPINSVTRAAIQFRDFGITEEGTMDAWQGMVYDTGSSEISFTRVTCTTKRFGIILDQTELCDIVACDFYITNGTLNESAGVWLVNGNDKRSANGLAGVSNPGYTNRITIQRCEFVLDENSVGIADDGGASHGFYDNNFDKGNHQIRLLDSSPFLIRGGEYEQAGSASIAMASGTMYLHTPRSNKSIGLIDGMFSATTTTVPSIELNNIECELTISNNFFNNPTNTIVNIHSGSIIHAFNNHQDGAANNYTSINNYLGATSYLPTFTSASGTPTIGNGSISGIYTRNGDNVTANIKIVTGSTTSYGTGALYFGLPVDSENTSDSGYSPSIGQAWCILGVYMIGVCKTEDAASKISVFVSNNTNTVQLTGSDPIPMGSGVVLELSITYRAKNILG